MGRSTLFNAALLSLAIIGGAHAAATPTSDALEERLKDVEKAEKRDIVMFQMQLGLAALKARQLEQAKRAFDFVLTDIESLFSDSEDAIKARSLWYEEGRKSFKGEPYERAMAYYYRGIIYLLEGEPDNARAAFLSGQLQDAFAEEDQHRADFALLMLMEAWSSKLMGSEQLAQAALQDFKLLRPEIELPSPETHAMFVVETGKGPRKLRDGISGESLVYRRGKWFDDKYVTAETDYRVKDLQPVSDLFYQATTRGDRVIDRINKGKAQYKSSWNDTGTSIAGLANQLTLVNNLTRDYSEYYSMENGVEVEISSSVNFGALSIGASALTLISSKIKPKADNRYWENLPDTVHIGFLPKDQLSDDAVETIKLYAQGGSKVDELAIEPLIKDGPHILYWHKVH